MRSEACWCKFAACRGMTLAAGLNIRRVTSINCRPKRQSKWNQRKGRDEEVDLECPLCCYVLEPGHEKMRLTRIRVLRFPFCLGRPSEPPNYLDKRDKRDPDPDGGGGNPYAPKPTLSATSVQSSPSSSTRSSAPSAPSVSSSNRYHTSNSTDMSVDKLPNLDAYLNEITKFNTTASHSLLLKVTTSLDLITTQGA